MANFNLLQAIPNQQTIQQIAPAAPQNHDGLLGLAQGIKQLVGNREAPQPQQNINLPNPAIDTIKNKIGGNDPFMMGMDLGKFHPDLRATMAGISSVESAGSKNPYMAISAPTRGDRAYGKYQIMGKNIPSWTRQALGKSLTVQEFLSDPTAQEKTTAFQINKSLTNGYSPQDAASIWFSGKPINKAGKVKDVYGTTVPDYVNRFNKGYLQFKVALDDSGHVGLTPPRKDLPGQLRPTGSPPPKQPIPMTPGLLRVL